MKKNLLFFVAKVLLLLLA